MDSNSDVTQILAQWRDGDTQALNRLIPRVYADLRSMASRRLAEHQGHDTLQPTALVHDMLLRLLGNEARDITDRKHFFNYAGRIMRQLLVDRARSTASHKRGGGMRQESLDEALHIPIPLPNDLDIEAIDQALVSLEALDPRMAKIVELRWFVGLTVSEVASALEIDPRTVHRDLAMAKAWLRDHIAQHD